MHATRPAANRASREQQQRARTALGPSSAAGPKKGARAPLFPKWDAATKLGASDLAWLRVSERREERFHAPAISAAIFETSVFVRPPKNRGQIHAKLRTGP